MILGYVLVGVLIVLGLALTIYGWEAFELGFYARTDRLVAGWVGSVSFLFGLCCLVILLDPGLIVG